MTTAWPMVSLGETCTFQNGGTPSRTVAAYFDGEIPWLTGADIEGSSAGACRTFLTDAGIKESPACVVPEGTILLVTRTGVGKVAIANRALSFSQDITALTPDPTQLDRRYLLRFLQTEADRFKAESRGATIQGVTREVVASTKIPLPPLDEQRRIAAILDKADEVRSKRKAALATLETLSQAIFIEMFGDPVTNPMRWDEGATLSVVADITSGVTKGRILRGNDLDLVTIPYLAVSNVQDGRLHLNVLKEIKVTRIEAERYRLTNGDLLLTEGGDPDKLGRGTIWRDEVANCIHQNHIFRVRIKSPDFHPVFVSFLIRSQRGRRYFFRSAKQTTGIASINKKQLGGFPMLMPPIASQERFVDVLQSLEGTQDLYVTAETKDESLFPSLQQRAFQGAL